METKIKCQFCQLAQNCQRRQRKQKYEQAGIITYCTMAKKQTGGILNDKH
jgi:hypothetical protein